MPVPDAGQITGKDVRAKTRPNVNIAAFDIWGWIPAGFSDKNRAINVHNRVEAIVRERKMMPLVCHERIW
eukprot:CAMPEP_0181192538 /NCGR_PEP_ID=MMETSP1096-20121128/13336_1 /TAXON_ID=156174 ORGANISM="Chrysochromulina ericina, Strain CCMP281" /NCGR_SAMPLE_ID=MMETSP1096 /ASSEMBLY_ACC=CAM_ASM_000453 /LENGTH=69 /DNA_ID=CAMNT_0023281939 /DNA_START=832 /DNA_END=1038 /DNA_ORIENTATION=+